MAKMPRFSFSSFFSERDDLQEYGMLMLRIGMASVFLWFGANQILKPDDWTGYLPVWAFSFFLSPETIVLINGIFETVFSILLILGVFVPFASLLLGLHLLAISISLGVNPVGVRDFGLAVATLSLALFRHNRFSLQKRIFKR
ncbi:DoxX family protein [Candidatus Woesearchaeota archaeon]|nr:MAG: DoxX family protein [Candidatus Woesearchaeota archaeon]